ncbi:hypothetical protein CEUSTIGMA_g5562.t1 [Chlamydomonas eustigma]|uniref:Uncharacterized protein n=1 Tax=Chlamydomonas eustigma TaxID=1157962 RepID=A0A250X5T6_9CHLO|nr:hypothetical protein CEUSTIGMA_g5562.t1 [Chlamydomonas eustigma]|eukprot:GAX78120.1 hypothetical protein CEUSTIGMA_g5562.t1 [Chlamydomonas eustigma]
MSAAGGSTTVGLVLLEDFKTIFSRLGIFRKAPMRAEEENMLSTSGPPSLKGTSISLPLQDDGHLASRIDLENKYRQDNTQQKGSLHTSSSFGGGWCTATSSGQPGNSQHPKVTVTSLSWGGGHHASNLQNGRVSNPALLQQESSKESDVSEMELSLKTNESENATLAKDDGSRLPQPKYQTMLHPSRADKVPKAITLCSVPLAPRTSKRPAQVPRLDLQRVLESCHHLDSEVDEEDASEGNGNHVWGREEQRQQGRNEANLDCEVWDNEEELASYMAPPTWVPPHEGKWYVYKPVDGQVLRRYAGLLMRLHPRQVDEVAALMDELSQAQYSCELMASRGIRIARDITSEWTRLTTGLIERIQAYEQTLVDTRQQLNDAQSQLHSLQSKREEVSPAVDRVHGRQHSSYPILHAQRCHSAHLYPARSKEPRSRLVPSKAVKPRSKNLVSGNAALPSCPINLPGGNRKELQIQAGLISSLEDQNEPDKRAGLTLEEVCNVVDKLNLENAALFEQLAAAQNQYEVEYEHRCRLQHELDNLRGLSQSYS